MAQVVVEMSGDEAKLFRAYQRIIDQASRLDGKAKENKRSHDDAFGASAVSALTNYATRLVSITDVLSAVQTALRGVREEHERLAVAQKTSGPALGQLAQLAETPAQMQRMVREAKATFAVGGAESLEQAAAMQFALESAGAGAMRPQFAQLQATGLVPNAQLMAESAAKLQKAFGTAKTGDLARIVSTAFGGGKIGLGTAEQLLAGAAGAGTFAQRIGLSPEETMAAVSTISGTLGPEGAATAAEQLFKNIEVQGITQKRVLKRDQSLAGYLGQIRALEAKGRPISEILGNRAEAVVAYGLLTNVEGQQNYGQNIANIAQAQRENWMQVKLGLAEQPAQVGAVVGRRRAEARRDVAMEEMGVWENLAQEVRADIMRKTYERGGLLVNRSPLATWAAGKMESAGIWWQGPEEYVRESGWRASADTQDRIARVLEQIEQNTRETSGRQRAAAGQQPE